MGIGGLLPLLKEIQRPARIEEWKGKTVAVDAYVWLHRGAYGCANELAQGVPTLKYVNYAMHRVRMLKYHGVTPLLVFDGGLLPSKMGTEDSREEKRQNARAKGNAFLAEGKEGQARECFVKAVDVTPAMAYQLIKALRREGFQYVVAPYEADPQLAYLEKAGIVDAIVTEDSDLLVFGCRNVLFKLDGEGNCVSISRDDFARCREYNFAAWSDAEFRQMAILSGCDYLDSIPGLGLKTAYRLLRKYKTAEKVVQFVRLEGQLTVPRDYLAEFRRAELTFLHQHVFDPVTRSLTHLNPLPEGMTLAQLPFIGPLLDADFARGLADGDIDPITKEAMVDLVPDSFPADKVHHLGKLLLTVFVTMQAPQPAPFKPTTGSSSSFYKPGGAKGKAAPAPVSGAGSIRSFFAPKPAAATTSANPANIRKANERVVLVGPSSGAEKAKGKEVVVVEEARESKFFGAKKATPRRSEVKKGKGKERAVEDDEEADVDALVGHDSGFVEHIEVLELDKTGAEQVDEDDLDAEQALHDVELSVELRSVVAVSDAEVFVTSDRSVALAIDADSPPEIEGAPSPSLPQCISSPSATPPRKRAKLSHDSPAPALDVRPPCSNSGLISSPPASDAAVAGGWKDDVAEAVDGALSSPLQAAPPLPPPVAPSARTTIKRETSAVDKQKKVTASPPARKVKKPATVELSSDPIILSSDAPDPALADEEAERTPRPALSAPVKREEEAKSSSSPRRRAAKKPKVAAQSADGRIKPPPQRTRDVGGGSTVKKREIEAVVLEDEAQPAGMSESGRKKGLGKKKAVEEEVEEVSDAVKEVAASWRAKFMMPLAAKTPLGRTAAGRSALPTTPLTTSRPPSHDKVKSALALSSTPKQRDTAASSRAPLSPRSTNRTSMSARKNPPSPLKLSRSSSSQEDVASSSPPAKKQRRHGSASIGAVALPLPSGLTSPASDAATAGTSSSPVVVTNPRLLAFKFRGTAASASASPRV
ncbi:hypothetical protein Rhopal_002058-T1 [Rhodotorula paludigena]|uniref:Exonuclease 1 n=1 Tax=Rhodotorula paludigena TaxID=86838 RepID=A0AAV5GGU4_9BASI|nr:hypothetical protein Rhopal_002058-T1 [Rhodotorula paludigena]